MPKSATVKPAPCPQIHIPLFDQNNEAIPSSRPMPSASLPRGAQVKPLAAGQPRSGAEPRAGRKASEHGERG